MSDNYYNNQNESGRDPFESMNNLQSANREIFNTGMFDEGYGSDMGYGTDMGYGNEIPVMPVGFDGIKTIATEKVVMKSFLFMFVALLITAFAALTTSPYKGAQMLSGANFWILIIAELVIVFASNAALKKNNVVLGGILYTVYSFLTGMLIAAIIPGFEPKSIASTFALTAGMFGGMALFGLATKKDLTKMGSIMLMGLWGVILTSVVNIMFIGSEIADLGISIVAVVIFTGLTAYDMQKIKNLCAYSTVENENALAMLGAFEIYLDFINLFLRLLRILGRRK